MMGRWDAVIIIIIIRRWSAPATVIIITIIIITIIIIIIIIISYIQLHHLFPLLGPNLCKAATFPPNFCPLAKIKIKFD